MLTILLRILAVLGLIWLVLRRLRGFVPVRHARPDPAGNSPQNTVRDPVCGMYMDPRLAIRVKDGDNDLFFCSEECRRRHLGKPA
jgi:YHS domain-containing protein